MVHLVNRDYEAMARDYYALDFLEESVDVRPIVPALAAFFDDVLEASVSDLNFKTITDGLGAVLYEYPFNVPAYYALILRSLTVLEGLALYTDPNFKVLGKAYPYMAKRLLTDPKPQLRDALEELLFKEGKFRWNRLENLLREGRKNDGFDANKVIGPLVSLALEGDENKLRPLVEAEAVRVVEALVVGGAITNSQEMPTLEGIPEPVRQFLLEQRTSGASSRISDRDLLALRAQVLTVWGLLTSTRGFDPSTLQPLVEVVQRQSTQEFGRHVTQGLITRVVARGVQEVLRSSPPQLPGTFLSRS